MRRNRTSGKRALGLAAALVALLWLVPVGAAALPVGDLWISEVLHNPTGADDGAEWVELFNAGNTAIDLSNYSLGWGGADYTTGTLQLTGTILPGQYFVVGGPNPSDGSPTYDQVANFTPDLENPFIASDGVALFNVPAASLDATTVPVHAVIYGGFGNFFGLMDETGAPGAVNAPWVGGGTSLVFDGTSWAASAAPDPGTGSLVPVPEAGTSLLMLLGLAGLARKGNPPRRLA